jgi:FkbM family methyltransferase
MSIMQGARCYYSLFGVYGLFLVAKARLLSRPIEVRFSLPGFPYPVHLRLRTSDVSLFWEILVDSAYDWEYETPQVIVDAGANAGLTSIFYANKYPESRIFAIEPESSNFEMLKKNTASYSNITAIQAALWNENRELRVFDPGEGLWGFRTGDFMESEEAARGGLVRGITVDKLMKDNCIDFIDLLKVDIEGAEREVFDDASAWIDRVGAIAIELHDRFKAGCSRSVLAAAKDFGLECQRGETNFLSRKGQMTTDLLPQNPPTESLASSSSRTRLGLPLKIERTGYAVR